jgi:hypothetical protein
MRTFTRGALPLLALAMLVATALPSSAAKPEVEKIVNLSEDDSWFVLPDIDCGTFTLTEDLVSETIRITTFVDRHGSPTEIVMKAMFEGVITHLGTGETFRDHSVFTESEDLVDGTVTVSGPSYHYIRTGHGQVYAEIGHKITLGYEGDPGYEILFQAGQDDYVQSGLDGLCDALG